METVKLLKDMITSQVTDPEAAGGMAGGGDSDIAADEGDTEAEGDRRSQLKMGTSTTAQTTRRHPARPTWGMNLPPRDSVVNMPPAFLSGFHIVSSPGLTFERSQTCVNCLIVRRVFVHNR